MRKLEVERLNYIDTTTMKNAGWFSVEQYIKVQPTDDIIDGSIRLNLGVSKSIHFIYTKVNESGRLKTYDSLIPLSTTPCHFGGLRYWFNCPNCNHRVAKIFEYNNNDLCRHCLNLTYASRNKNGKGKRGARNRFFDLQEKVELLEDKAVRQTWRGVPTKKRQRIVKVQKQILAYCDFIETRELV